MSKSNVLENDLLKLILHGTAIANLADNAVSSPLTSLYMSLHTADPGEGGDQTTNETSYTSYVRLAVTRNSGGWTITNNVANPANDLIFATCTGGPTVITYAALGTASTGTGKILYSGPVSPPISVSNGVAPKLTTASSITED